MAVLTLRTSAAATVPTWTPSTSECVGGGGGWIGPFWGSPGAPPCPHSSPNAPHSSAPLPGASWISISRSCAPSHCPTSTSTPASSAGSTSRVRPPGGRGAAGGGMWALPGVWCAAGGGTQGTPRDGVAASKGHQGMGCCWGGCGGHPGAGLLPGGYLGTSVLSRGDTGDTQGYGRCLGG